MPRVMVFVDGPNIGRRDDLIRILEVVVRGRNVVATRYYDSQGPDGKTSFHELLEGFGMQVTLLPHPRHQELVDYEIIVDMLSSAYENQFDVAILVSGDVGFTSAVRKVQGLGKRVEVASFPGQVARELREGVAELHDLAALASQVRRHRSQEL